jgi:cytochrome c peroxidase
VRMFAEAFPGADDPLSDQVITQSVTRAIASFERTLISGNSPYDRFRLGKDDHAISAAAQHGLDLFLQSEAENCFHCHQAFNLTTSSDYKGLLAPNITFVNTGLYNLRCSDFNLPALDLLWCDNPPDPASCMQQTDSQPLGCHCDGTGPQQMGCYPPPNTGTYSVVDQPQNMGRFKPPTLRNIAVTAPYMHDGSIATLDAVLDHYSAGGRTITDGPYAGVGADSPTKGQFLRGFALNDADRAALIAFLQSLTDQDFLTDPHFADPFKPVSCPGDCNLDGKVDVNELVSAIGVSLNASSLAICVTSDSNGDGAVTIDELLRAIGGALNGCG